MANNQENIKPVSKPSGQPTSKNPGGRVNGSVDGVKVDSPPKRV